MFIYCGNSPVLFQDTSGTRHEISAGAGGCPVNYVDRVSWFERLEEDLTNEDPDAALDDEFLNFYKGVPVIKTPIMDNSSFSFGVIFMGDQVKSATLLNHEYGHVEQLHEIGILGYVQYIVLPSVSCFAAMKTGLLPNSLYYNLPWEKKADEYGNVQRDYYSWADDFADIYWWLATIGTGITYK